MREAFVDKLTEEAARNPDIVLITGDLGYGVLDKFSSNFPNQFINAGINEQSMMGMAAGYASTGKKVFVYSIGNFSTLRCLEQIRNDICLMDNSVVVVSVGAGYAYGSQGYTHHALEDLAIMRALPNIDVISPADPLETTLITEFLCTSKRPAYLRLGKSKDVAIHKQLNSFSPGRIFEVHSGTEGTILFCGSVGTVALKAQAELSKSGITVAVASVPFVSSLDGNYLSVAFKKGPVVTVEEHGKRGGLGSAILEYASEIGEFARIGIIASAQENLSLIGDQEFLRETNGITSGNVVQKFMALMEVAH
jgi:transketolase